MRLEKPVTQKELSKELKQFATKDDLGRVEENVKDLRDYVHGMETRIQAQFEAQTAEFDVKLDTKLSKLYSDLVSQFQFIAEQMTHNKYDELDLRVSKLEQRVFRGA